MKNLLTLLSFTFIILLIGRNLTFLPRFELFTSKESETKRLRSDVQKIISKAKGNYSIYYEDFKKGYSFGINEKQVYIGASVNKVPIIAALYYLANKGSIDLDEKITLQKEDIQDYGTGRLRYEEPGSIYSLKTLAKLALQESDNTAAHIIASKIGMENVQKIINKFGLAQTDMVNNKTSVFDMSILYKKIYKGQITSQALTKELLGFMKNTDTEDRLPRLLSDDTNVFHKTGDCEGCVHDVGIIEKNETVFFLGVMTSDIGNNENETKETIGKIAKEVFNFYLRLK